ncbi:MAG: pyruvate kinase [Armatimonadota bacterium]
MSRTKIVCTLGPATESPEMLRALVDAGMRVARINCSHGTPEEHAERIRAVRAVSQESGVAVSVLYDLSGPKIRTGDMAEPVMLEPGKEFTLTSREQLAPGEVPLGFAELPRLVQPGQHILLDDGNLQADIVSVSETDIVCTATVSGPLGSHKGINLPGVSLPIPAVTDKDMEDLRRGLRLGVDWIALSFVRSADDILPVREIMDEEGVQRPIIAKIEKHEAIDNLEAILDAFDGVMVARGDLGVEVALERIPLLQKEIIRAANHQGKPVITATQMLDSMIRNPRPTRAEVTDVANAILDGTDAVMLSGETAVGKYPREAVQTMSTVADWAETLLPEDVVPTKLAPQYNRPTGSLAAAAVDIAAHLGARAIVTATERGHTTTLVSKSRPHQPIIAITGSAETYTQLPLLWGVTPFLVQQSMDADEMLDRAVRAACKAGMVDDGDLLIIVAVTPQPQPIGVVTRASNILRIAHVERNCRVEG